MGLVHFSDNALGTISMSWNRRPSSPAVRSGRRGPGLTTRGVEVVAELNARGMLIDLAYADRATTLAVCERTTMPVISSHTGARALQDFPHYLDDDEIRAIADTGGLVGLWPFRSRGQGIADLDDFARHADHLARIAGPAQVCVGTDMNGVPGLMAGYRGEPDFPVLTAALRRAGFSHAEVAGIISGNMTRVVSRAAADCMMASVRRLQDGLAAWAAPRTAAASLLHGGKQLPVQLAHFEPLRLGQADRPRRT